MIQRLILSDIHAGLASSRWPELPAIIAKVDPKQVIAVGDLFDSAPFLPFGEWIDALRKISQERELTLIYGNHDEAILPPIAKHLGLPCYASYSWQDSNGLNICVHGNIYPGNFHQIGIGFAGNLGQGGVVFNRIIPQISMNANTQTIRILEGKTVV